MIIVALVLIFAVPCFAMCAYFWERDRPMAWIFAGAGFAIELLGILSFFV